MAYEFKKYRRKGLAEMRPYTLGEDMDGISVAAVDAMEGSPQAGDMVARNPENHDDQWLVAKKYFQENFEQVPDIV